MKCVECEYCKFYGPGLGGGLHCEHPDIYKSAKEYEQNKGISINKSFHFISHNMRKTSLRWCPLKNPVINMEAKKTNLQHYIDNIIYDAGCIMSKILNCEGDCEACKYDDSSEVAAFLMEEYKEPNNGGC